MSNSLSSFPKAKFLGPGKGGTSHHIHQRVTAIFMVPLLMWFVATIILFLQKPPSEIPWFLTSPVTIIGSVLFILNAFYHASLGLKIVIGDYVHSHYLKVVMILLMYATIIVTVVAGLIAIFTIYILLRIN